MNARRFATSLLLLGALTTAGCSRSEDSAATLSPARAADALTAKMLRVFPYVRFIDGMAADSDPDESGVYAVLARRGILRPYFASSPLSPKPELHYRLTASGHRWARGWRRFAKNDYLAAVGSYQLEGVTTVETLASGYAMVTYRYRVALNDIGVLLYASKVPDLRYFDSLSSRPNTIARAAAASTGLAELTLRDRGWAAE